MEKTKKNRHSTRKNHRPELDLRTDKRATTPYKSRWTVSSGDQRRPRKLSAYPKSRERPFSGFRNGTSSSRGHFFPFRFAFCPFSSPRLFFRLYQSGLGVGLRRVRRDRKMSRQSYLKYAGYKTNEFYDGLPWMSDGIDYGFVADSSREWFGLMLCQVYCVDLCLFNNIWD